LISLLFSRYISPPPHSLISPIGHQAVIFESSSPCLKISDHNEPQLHVHRDIVPQQRSSKHQGVVTPSRELGDEAAQHRMLAEILCIPVCHMRLQGKIDEHSCLVSTRSSIPGRLSSTYPREAGNVLLRSKMPSTGSVPGFRTPLGDKNLKYSSRAFKTSCRGSSPSRRDSCLSAGVLEVPQSAGWGLKVEVDRLALGEVAISDKLLSVTGSPFADAP